MSMSVYRDLEDQEICKALDSDLAVGWDGSPFNQEESPDRALGTHIYAVYSMCKELKRYKYPPYKFDRSDPSDVRTFPLKSASLFLPPPEVGFFEQAKHFPVILHPSVDKYANLWSDYKLTLDDFGKVGSDNDGKFAERINDFAMELAGYYKHSSFKQKETAVDKHCQQQFRQCLELLSSLEAKKDTLLIKRVDHWIRPQAVAFSEDQLHHIFSSFLHNRRKDEVFKQIQGVVVKTQFSAHWGLGLNVTYFIKEGTQVRGRNVADYLGEVWDHEVCGSSLGVSMNCEKHPNPYKRAGLGVFYFEDTGLEQQLLSSLAYLTKVGRFLMAGSGVVCKQFY